MDHRNLGAFPISRASIWPLFLNFTTVYMSVFINCHLDLLLISLYSLHTLEIVKFCVL